MTTPAISDERLAHFQARVVQDAMAQATAAYWLRRAATFDWVGTPRCDEIARACRYRAAVEQMPDVDARIDAVLAEYSQQVVA